MKPEPVVLVDVFNLVWRSHFVFQNLESEGRPTGVIYGVLRAINELQENISRKIIFCWDHGVPVPGAAKPRNWRDGFLSSYKANRKRDDDSTSKVFGQLRDVKRVIDWLGYSHVSVLGLEADDVIGILASEIDGPVLIFSTDKDFYQLLNERTEILVPKKDKGTFNRITQQSVEREYGFPIDRWAEFLALGGDSCDNVKAMRGMGPKTAAKLIHLGVDLRQSLEEQPIEFREKYGSVWEAIAKIYAATRIPLSWNDTRIKTCMAGQSIIYRPNQYWGSVMRDAARKHFEEFCADHELVTMLALRHKFFERSEKDDDLSCQNQKSSPNRLNRPKSRQRPRDIWGS